MNRNIRWNVNSKNWVIRNREINRTLVGRTSFDWATLVSYHYSGQGDTPGTGLDVAKRWVEHNQRLFDREDVVLAVFNEEGGWSPCPGDPPPCMFGQGPRDQRDKDGKLIGIWDIENLRDLSRRGERVRDLTSLNKRVIEFAFQVSHETGCIFDWVVDATLKHTDGVSIDVIDHVIRQTAAYMRTMSEKYPNAAFFFRARNEWNAHDPDVTLAKVNAWATRFYRWRNEVSGETRVSFSEPGPFQAEQWPEGFIIVDGGGGNTIFGVDVGPEPGKFQAAAFHQDRRRGKGDLWMEPIPANELQALRADARGMPLMNTENMYMVSKPGTEGWYRGPDGWNNDIEKQIRFYENNAHLVDYFCVHDDIGKKANPDWNRTEQGFRWEAALIEFFGGQGSPAPEPPPPPPALRYQRIIAQAYQEILGRGVDTSGLGHYNAAMAAGMTEAQMRESLIRSPEFEEKNS